MPVHQTQLFAAGDHGYDTFRIPALRVARDGTLFAFAEGRRESAADHGPIDLVLRRSADGGRTWGDLRVIISEPGMTCGNPAPVLDRSAGRIWLLLTQNPADLDEEAVCRDEADRTIWITSSDDAGTSRAQAREITSDVKRPEWTWYATGPCHGIQLESGRLVVPCDHRVGVAFTRDDPGHSHVIYSDDGGASWQVGGIVDEGTNESTVVETVDGRVYINCRNIRGTGHHRVVAWSTDGGQSFGPASPDPALVEAVCQASVVRLSRADEHGRNRVLFANPASRRRERLTLRVSHDEARTWPRERVLYDGPAAYSDLAVDAALNVFCLYERGAGSPYEGLWLARMDLDWLEG